VTSPNYAVSLHARMVEGSGEPQVGLVVTRLDSGAYTASTAAARADGRRSSGLIVRPGLGGGFAFQSHGDIDPELTGLAPAASASYVRVTDAATLERVAPNAIEETDDIVGYAEKSGLMHALFGQPWRAGEAGNIPSGGDVGQVLRNSEPGTAVWSDETREIPTGGTTGQIVRKSGDGTLVWSNETQELPSGGTDGQILRRVTGAPAWSAETQEVPSGGNAGEALLSNGTGGRFWGAVEATGPIGEGTGVAIVDDEGVFSTVPYDDAPTQGLFFGQQDGSPAGGFFGLATLVGEGDEGDVLTLGAGDTVSWQPGGGGGGGLEFPEILSHVFLGAYLDGDSEPQWTTQEPLSGDENDITIAAMRGGTPSSAADVWRSGVVPVDHLAANIDGEVAGVAFGDLAITSSGLAVASISGDETSKNVNLVLERWGSFGLLGTGSLSANAHPGKQGGKGYVRIASNATPQEVEFDWPNNCTGIFDVEAVFKVGLVDARVQRTYRVRRVSGSAVLDVLENGSGDVWDPAGFTPNAVLSISGTTLLLTLTTGSANPTGCHWSIDGNASASVT
jgi:hypothetical protein